MVSVFTFITYDFKKNQWKIGCRLPIKVNSKENSK